MVSIGPCVSQGLPSRQATRAAAPVLVRRHGHGRDAAVDGAGPGDVAPQRQQVRVRAILGRRDVHERHKVVALAALGLLGVAGHNPRAVVHLVDVGQDGVLEQRRRHRRRHGDFGVRLCPRVHFGLAEQEELRPRADHVARAAKLEQERLHLVARTRPAASNPPQHQQQLG